MRGSGIAAYPPPPATLEISDEELNAGLSLICDANQILSFGKKLGVISEKNMAIDSSETSISCQFFNNFKIKFEEGGYSATARLLKPIKGNVSIKGSIALLNEKNTKVVFQEVYLDGKLAPAETTSLLENTANQEMNRILDKMQYLSIDSIDVSPGKITIKGVFSFDELLCIIGITNYCLSIAPPVVF